MKVKESNIFGSVSSILKQIVFLHRLEEVYCAETVNATVDTPELDMCLTRVKDKEENEKAKKTWFSIIFILAAFFVAFISKYT